MKQTYIWTIVGLVLLVLIVGFYFYQKTAITPSAEKAMETVKSSQKAMEAVKETTVSAVKMPEINPLEKANPFKKTYQNPFE